MITISPLKGRFAIGEELSFRLIEDTSISSCTGLSPLGIPPERTVRVELWDLASKVFDQILPLDPDGTLSVPYSCQNAQALTVVVHCEGGRIAYTAVDIGTDNDIIRYGFLSDFAESDTDTADLEFLASMHINRVQFYDWSYRHDHLVACQEDYRDMMGKHNNLEIIRLKIDGCHRRGMLASAYGAVYAASREFWSEHRDWGLYAQKDVPLTFIDVFYYMNIAKDCPWHGHIIDQYVQAIRDVGFDGIHMDTYGFPKRALDSSFHCHYLDDEFPVLIEDAKVALESARLPSHLIFNNVGAWPMHRTAATSQDAVYIEVWSPFDTYCQLKDLILQALPYGKSVILAAYLAPFRTDEAQRALRCALLASFVINTNGATHLFLGESQGVLTQGYYCDYTHINADDADLIRLSQDYFVQYQALLFDRTLVDVSLTHCMGDNREVRCSIPFSVTGEPDRLWVTIRQNKSRTLMVLTNLNGNDDVWNEGKDVPCPSSLAVFSFQIQKPVEKVWYAPYMDADIRLPISLPFSVNDEPWGTVLNLTVPPCRYGGIVWFDQKLE